MYKRHKKPITANIERWKWEKRVWTRSEYHNHTLNSLVWEDVESGRRLQLWPWEFVESWNKHHGRAEMQDESSLLTSPPASSLQPPASSLQPPASSLQYPIPLSSSSPSPDLIYISVFPIYVFCKKHLKMSHALNFWIYVSALFYENDSISRKIVDIVIQIISLHATARTSTGRYRYKFGLFIRWAIVHNYLST